MALRPYPPGGIPGGALRLPHREREEQPLRCGSPRYDRAFHGSGTSGPGWLGRARIRLPTRRTGFPVRAPVAILGVADAWSRSGTPFREWFPSFQLSGLTREPSPDGTISAATELRWRRTLNTKSRGRRGPVPVRIPSSRPERQSLERELRKERLPHFEAMRIRIILRLMRDPCVSVCAAAFGMDRKTKPTSSDQASRSSSAAPWAPIPPSPPFIPRSARHSGRRRRRKATPDRERFGPSRPGRCATWSSGSNPSPQAPGQSLPSRMSGGETSGRFMPAR